MAPGSRRITRNMGITHNEFFRLLPKALNGAPFSRRQNRIAVTTDNGTINITLSAESVRKIASLTLPVTEVTLEFTGFTTDTCQSFMHRFDLAYQRGGG